MSYSIHDYFARYYLYDNIEFFPTIQSVDNEDDFYLRQYLINAYNNYLLELNNEQTKTVDTLTHASDLPENSVSNASTILDISPYEGNNVVIEEAPTSNKLSYTDFNYTNMTNNEKSALISLQNSKHKIKVNEPVEPVEPTEPTEPTEPVEPVEPTEPVEPVEALCFNLVNINNNITEGDEIQIVIETSGYKDIRDGDIYLQIELTGDDRTVCLSEVDWSSIYLSDIGNINIAIYSDAQTGKLILKIPQDTILEDDFVINIPTIDNSMLQTSRNITFSLLEEPYTGNFFDAISQTEQNFTSDEHATNYIELTNSGSSSNMLDDDSLNISISQSNDEITESIASLINYATYRIDVTTTNTEIAGNILQNDDFISISLTLSAADMNLEADIDLENINFVVLNKHGEIKYAITNYTMQINNDGSYSFDFIIDDNFNNGDYIEVDIPVIADIFYDSRESFSVSISGNISNEDLASKVSVDDNVLQTIIIDKHSSFNLTNTSSDITEGDEIQIVIETSGYKDIRDGDIYLQIELTGDDRTVCLTELDWSNIHLSDMGNMNIAIYSDAQTGKLILKIPQDTILEDDFVINIPTIDNSMLQTSRNITFSLLEEPYTGNFFDAISQTEQNFTSDEHATNYIELTNSGSSSNMLDNDSLNISISQSNDEITESIANLINYATYRIDVTTTNTEIAGNILQNDDFISISLTLSAADMNLEADIDLENINFVVLNKHGEIKYAITNYTMQINSDGSYSFDFIIDDNFNNGDYIEVDIPVIADIFYDSRESFSVSISGNISNEDLASKVSVDDNVLQTTIIDKHSSFNLTNTSSDITEGDEIQIVIETSGYKDIRDGDIYLQIELTGGDRTVCLSEVDWSSIHLSDMGNINIAIYSDAQTGKLILKIPQDTILEDDFVINIPTIDNSMLQTSRNITFSLLEEPYTGNFFDAISQTEQNFTSDEHATNYIELTNSGSSSNIIDDDSLTVSLDTINWQTEENRLGSFTMAAEFVINFSNINADLGENIIDDMDSFGISFVISALEADMSDFDLYRGAKFYLYDESNNMMQLVFPTSYDYDHISDSYMYNLTLDSSMIKNGHKLFAHVAAINDDSFEGDELFKVSIKNWSDETNIDSSKIIVDNEFELGNIVDTSIPRALQAKEENMHDLQDYVNLQEDTRILENIFQSNGASDNIITSPDTTQSMHNLDASYYFENNFLIYDNSYDAIIESYANLL